MIPTRLSALDVTRLRRTSYKAGKYLLTLRKPLQRRCRLEAPTPNQRPPIARPHLLQMADATSALLARSSTRRRSSWVRTWLASARSQPESQRVSAEITANFSMRSEEYGFPLKGTSSANARRPSLTAFARFSVMWRRGQSRCHTAAAACEYPCVLSVRPTSAPGLHPQHSTT